MFPWGHEKPEGQPKHKPLYSSLDQLFNWLKRNWLKLLIQNPKCQRCSLLRGRKGLPGPRGWGAEGERSGRGGLPATVGSGHLCHAQAPDPHRGHPTD